VSGVDGREARSGPPSGKSGDELLFLAITAAVMAIFITFNVFNVYHETLRDGRRLGFWEPVVWEASSGLVFLVALPVITALTRRVWPVGRPYLPKLAFHLLAAIVVSLVHVLAIGAIRWGVYRVVGDYYAPLAPLGDWPYEFRKDVLVYASVAATYVGWRYIRRAEPSREDSFEVLEVRDGARRHFVPLADVAWVEAAGNYVELHRDGAGLLHRASLSEMERRLQGAGFVRIHRSRLVRRGAVAAVESKTTGDFTVRLRDGRELAGSRRYRHPLLAD
jgi:hypothetical protein